MALVTPTMLGVVVVGGPAGAAAARHSAHPVGRLAAIRAYWTPARMRSAIPIEGPASSRPSGRAGAARAHGTTANMHQGGAGGVHVPRSVGKLFFTDGNARYVCSAAAIDTKSRNQVLTAGHCVHTGPARKVEPDRRRSTPDLAGGANDVVFAAKRPAASRVWLST